MHKLNANTQETSSRYRLLLDTMRHGVQENDCSGTITYSNRAHHEILGYDDDQLIGKKIWDFFPSLHEKEQLQKYFTNLIREQPAPEPYVSKCIRYDGSLVDLQIDWDYEYDAEGTLLGFISVITDITERIRTEEKLLRRTQGLATLLETTRNLAASLDLENVLQAAVEGITQLVGLDTAAVYLLEDAYLHLWATTPPLPPQFPDALKIAPIADHPHIHKVIDSREPFFLPDMKKADLSQAERAVQNERNLRTVLFVPLIMENKTIGVFIVGSVEQPSIVADGDIDLSITLANLAALTVRNAQLFTESREKTAQLKQTLADRIQAEKERNELAEQLQQAQRMESIGRLAGGVAHDFNNMLSVILGHAELALAKADSSFQFYKDLVQIRDATLRSADLTRQLLGFARKQAATPMILDLNEVIGNILQLLRRLIGEDIDLVWIPGKDIGSIKMDSAQVDQILTNLCVNARDAIAQEGKVTIETGKASFDEAYCAEHPGFLPGPYVMIAISDNGIGMDKEIVSNIFEPYFSTKPIGKGTGLGLSTVYGIVKQNEGFINVYTEPGQGTTFKIYLPKHNGAKEQSTVKTKEHLQQGGDETILLVEDEMMILDLATEMLKALGYIVYPADSPTKALQLARDFKGTIDLLITDVVMPEMNGRDLAQKIESLFPKMQTLYISGYTANVIAHHGVLDQGVKLLSKPFTIQELATKVRQAINTK